MFGLCGPPYDIKINNAIDKGVSLLFTHNSLDREGNMAAIITLLITFRKGRNLT